MKDSIKMTQKLLETEYQKIENNLQPIIEFLEKNKEKDTYNQKYKGITTMLSPLKYRPDILFLGINPGPGAYREQNQTTNTNITPLKMLNKNEEHFKQLDWFKKNTSRGAKKNGHWEAYDWFQRDKPINNIFPSRMIDILYNVAELKHPDSVVKDNEEPSWSNEIQEKIVVTNLYPIVTDDTSVLSKIFTSLLKEKDLKPFFKKYNIKSNWDLRLYFITHYLDNIISLIKPKVIVCMGHTSYKDFTYTKQTNLDKIIETTKKINNDDYKVISFTRSGNWFSLIEEISNRIFNKLKI